MLFGFHRRSVSQRIVARATTHLSFDSLQAAASRCSYAMVPIGEEHPLRGIEDDDGWQRVEHLGVPHHPCSVEVRLGIDLRVREEISDSQLCHRAHRRRQLDEPQPQSRGQPCLTGASSCYSLYCRQGIFSETLPTTPSTAPSSIFLPDVGVLETCSTALSPPAGRFLA